MDKDQVLINEAKKMLENHRTIDQVLTNLTARGLSEEKAGNIIHSASLVANIKKKEPAETNEKSGNEWIGILIFAFILIRWIIRSMNN